MIKVFIYIQQRIYNTYSKWLDLNMTDYKGGLFFGITTESSLAQIPQHLLGLYSTHYILVGLARFDHEVCTTLSACGRVVQSSVVDYAALRGTQAIYLTPAVRQPPGHIVLGGPNSCNLHSAQKPPTLQSGPATWAKCWVLRSQG